MFNRFVCLALLLLAYFVCDAQVNNRAGKWGNYFSGGASIFQGESKAPVRGQLGLTCGQHISERFFLGLEVGTLDYRERRGKSNNLMGSSAISNTYKAHYVGPKAAVNLYSVFVLNGGFGIGKADRTIGKYFSNSGLYGTGYLGIGADLLTYAGKGNVSLIPTFQYKIDYFGVEEPGTTVFPNVSKIRNSVFVLIEFGVRFGKGKI